MLSMVSLGISISSIIGSGIYILEEPDMKLSFIIMRVYIASCTPVAPNECAVFELVLVILGN